MDDDAFFALENVAGDAQIIRQTDFTIVIALGDPGIEFVRHRIIEEKAGALGLQLPGDHLDERIQDLVQGANRGHPARDIEQHIPLFELLGRRQQFLFLIVVIVLQFRRGWLRRPVDRFRLLQLLGWAPVTGHYDPPDIR